MYMAIYGSISGQCSNQIGPILAVVCPYSAGITQIKQLLTFDNIVLQFFASRL